MTSKITFINVGLFLSSNQSQRILRVTSLPMRAPKTKMIQMMMKASIAVSPSALGILLVMLLKMLTRQRNTVTRMVILPGTLSGGTRKLIQETMTNMPVGKQQVMMQNAILRLRVNSKPVTEQFPELEQNIQRQDAFKQYCSSKAVLTSTSNGKCATQYCHNPSPSPSPKSNTKVQSPSPKSNSKVKSPS